MTAPGRFKLDNDAYQHESMLTPSAFASLSI